MNSKLNYSEIKEFLNDVNNYLKSQLQCLNYQNAIIPTEFDIERSRELMNRCETIIECFGNIENAIRNQKIAYKNRISIISTSGGGGANGGSCTDSSADGGGSGGVGSCDVVINSYRENFQDECHGNSDAGDVIGSECVESSYLDMSIKTERSTSEYVDVSSPLAVYKEKSLEEDSSAEIYNICDVSSIGSENLPQLSSTNENASEPIGNIEYDTASIISCPYSGLPAAHLPMKKSPKYGHLTRIAKHLLFDMTKKFYCGIIEEWLLCYKDSHSLKPTICLHLKDATVNNYYGSYKRRDSIFEIVTNKKKIIFQSVTEPDAKEWMRVIRLSANTTDHHNHQKVSHIDSGRVNKSSDLCHNQRKLPTPPMHNRNSNKKRSDTAEIEEIYEEPWLYDNKTLFVNCKTSTPKKTLATTQSEQLSDSPPIIPTKIGKTIKSNVARKCEYDVPSKTQSSGAIYQDIDTNDVERNKSEFQTKMKDVQNKLIQNWSSGISPDTMKDKKANIRNCDSKKIKGSTSKDKSTISTTPSSNGVNIFSEKQATPVKHWFLSRLQKLPVVAAMSSRQGTSAVQNDAIVKGKRNEYVEKLTKSRKPTTATTTVPPIVNENENTQTTQNNEMINRCNFKKDSKVNKIVNELEAKGHTPIFTQNFKQTIDKGDYETIESQLCN